MTASVLNTKTTNYQSSIEQGDRLRDDGALEEALKIYRSAIESNPECALGHYKLGVTLDRLGHTEEAISSYREALRLQPVYPEALNNLGLILMVRGDLDNAETCFRDTLSIKIDYFQAHLNLAQLLGKGPRKAEAIYHFQRALLLKPDSAAACEKYGSLLFDISRVTDAITMLSRAIVLDPTSCQAWLNLASCQMAQGDLALAEISNQEAMRLDPSNINPWQNLLFRSNYEKLSPKAIFEKHLAFGRHLENSLGDTERLQHFNSLDPERKLRIGFVSGDFRRHSVSHFIESVFATINPEVIELWAYYNHPLQDAKTIELKPLFTEWRKIEGMSDADASKLVQQDKIDILFDLAGPTGFMQLGIFARKPAPIQVSWIGYPNTTGLATIDYRFTDKWADPEGNADQYHTESLIRLPSGFLCYTPHRDAPAVKPPPSSLGRPFTFGSFNSMVKIGDETLALWAKVLSSVPDARLLIKSAGSFYDPKVREGFLFRLRSAGIDPARVTLKPPERSDVEHFSLYGDIDVALDTYPYHGTTTTCEALWMGVPVVTLAGDRHAARVGVSLLNNVGLPHLVARTAEEYAGIAQRLASNPEHLAELRATMRDRLKNSPLLDAVSMARNVESALRNMWRKFCAQNTQSPASKGQPQTGTCTINMQGGYQLVVEDDPISDPTSWIALEQEDWFEDEIHFLRNICNDYWHVLDVGADHGTYTLSMASLGAKVWVLEATGNSRRKLRDGVAENRFDDRVRILPYCLTSITRTGSITVSQQFTQGATLSSKQQDQVDEEIRLVTLDSLIGKDIPESLPISFVRLQTGEQLTDVLRGGLRFFCAQSPLVMFDYRQGQPSNDVLLDTFHAMGYNIFRFLPALNALVPISKEQAITLCPYTLNLFACKSDTAEKLAKQGHLTSKVEDDVSDLQPEWIQVLFSLSSLKETAIKVWQNHELNSDYGRALLSWCGSRKTELPLEKRHRLLEQSLQLLMEAFANEDSHPAVAILGIRISSDLGMRAQALSIASDFLEQMAPDEEFPLDRPLPPAYEIFDARLPKTSVGGLIYQSVVEFFADKGAHSRFFQTIPDEIIARGMRNPEHSARMERHLILFSIRKGIRPHFEVLEKLFQSSADNLNPELWAKLVKAKN